MAFRQSEPWLRATLRTSPSRNTARSSIRVLSGRARARQGLPPTAIATRLETRPALASRAYATVVPPPAAVQHGVEDIQDSLRAIKSGDSYDIVIIGAGNAGLALACALLSKPALSERCRILLVDAGNLDKVRGWTGEGHWENRVSSLTADNVNYLRDIGAWKHIAVDRSCPVKEMIVWTSSTPSSSSTIAFPELSQPMAYMTENTNLQRALLRRIEEVGEGRVEIAEKAKVEKMQMGEGGRWVGLQLEGRGWVKGGVVVGADGPNSPVRAFSQIDSFGHAYNTHGIVATMHHAPTYNHTAFQRFLPTGPLAFLPLSSTSSTMVWSTTPELAKAYKTLGVEALTHLVNCGFYAEEQELERFNTALLENRGVVVDPSVLEDVATRSIRSLATEDLSSFPPVVKLIDARSIASFPLKLTHAESYIGDRTVLVGDAAHTIHPLAGQGLNMGLGDVRVLADVWEETVCKGEDVGSYTAMLPYTRQRYPANHLLLSTTDKLHHIFRTRIPIVNWARSLGMDVINELGPVKKALMERAGAQPVTGGAAKGGVYSTAADALDGWKSFKGLAGFAVAAGGEVVKNGARRLLERVAK